MDVLDYNPPSTVLSPLRSCLVLVDLQESLMPFIHNHEEVVKEALRLTQIAHTLDIPTIGTEQNAARLGPNVAALKALCSTTLDKEHFNACALEQLPQAIPTGRSQIVLAGCEAHVCLMQTGLGLLHQGYDVFVVAEACGSRRAQDKERGLRRLEQAGAVLISPEMAGFEWLKSFKNPRFRDVLALIKPL
ncbi:MAG TPA: isochorismatase family protein [Alcanivoracaceae bacterium]|nr:isochorismatase family protein [Alcanivoracaceae bacterium]